MAEDLPSEPPSVAPLEECRLAAVKDGDSDQHEKVEGTDDPETIVLPMARSFSGSFQKREETQISRTTGKYTAMPEAEPPVWKVRMMKENEGGPAVSQLASPPPSQSPLISNDDPDSQTPAPEDEVPVVDGPTSPPPSPRGRQGNASLAGRRGISAQPAHSEARPSNDPLGAGRWSSAPPRMIRYGKNTCHAFDCLGCNLGDDFEHIGSKPKKERDGEEEEEVPDVDSRAESTPLSLRKKRGLRDLRKAALAGASSSSDGTVIEVRVSGDESIRGGSPPRDNEKDEYGCSPENKYLSMVKHRNLLKRAGPEEKSKRKTAGRSYTSYAEAMEAQEIILSSALKKSWVAKLEGTVKEVPTALPVALNGPAIAEPLHPCEVDPPNTPASLSEDKGKAPVAPVAYHSFNAINAARANRFSGYHTKQQAALLRQVDEEEKPEAEWRILWKAHIEQVKLLPPPDMQLLVRVQRVRDPSILMSSAKVQYSRSVGSSTRFDLQAKVEKQREIEIPSGYKFNDPAFWLLSSMGYRFKLDVDLKSPSYFEEPLQQSYDRGNLMRDKENPPAPGPYVDHPAPTSETVVGDFAHETRGKTFSSRMASEEEDDCRYFACAAKVHNRLDGTWYWGDDSFEVRALRPAWEESNTERAERHMALYPPELAVRALEGPTLVSTAWSVMGEPAVEQQLRGGSSDSTLKDIRQSVDERAALRNSTAPPSPLPDIDLGDTGDDLVSSRQDEASCTKPATWADMVEEELDAAIPSQSAWGRKPRGLRADEKWKALDKERAALRAAVLGETATPALEDPETPARTSSGPHITTIATEVSSKASNGGCVEAETVALGAAVPAQGKQGFLLQVDEVGSSRASEITELPSLATISEPKSGVMLHAGCPIRLEHFPTAEKYNQAINLLREAITEEENQTFLLFEGQHSSIIWRSHWLSKLARWSDVHRAKYPSSAQPKGATIWHRPRHELRVYKDRHGASAKKTWLLQKEPNYSVAETPAAAQASASSTAHPHSKVPPVVSMGDLVWDRRLAAATAQELKKDIDHLRATINKEEERAFSCLLDQLSSIEHRAVWLGRLALASRLWRVRRMSFNDVTPEDIKAYSEHHVALAKKSWLPQKPGEANHSVADIPTAAQALAPTADPEDAAEAGAQPDASKLSDVPTASAPTMYAPVPPPVPQGYARTAKRSGNVRRTSHTQDVGGLFRPLSTSKKTAQPFDTGARIRRKDYLSPKRETADTLTDSDLHERPAPQVMRWDLLPNVAENMKRRFDNGEMREDVAAAFGRIKGHKRNTSNVSSVTNGSSDDVRRKEETPATDREGRKKKTSLQSSSEGARKPHSPCVARKAVVDILSQSNACARIGPSSSPSDAVAVESDSGSCRAVNTPETDDSAPERRFSTPEFSDMSSREEGECCSSSSSSSVDTDDLPLPNRKPGRETIHRLGAIEVEETRKDTIAQGWRTSDVIDISLNAAEKRAIGMKDLQTAYDSTKPVPRLWSRTKGPSCTNSSGYNRISNARPNIIPPALSRDWYTGVWMESEPDIGYLHDCGGPSAEELPGMGETLPVMEHNLPSNTTIQSFDALDSFPLPHVGKGEGAPLDIKGVKPWDAFMVQELEDFERGVRGFPPAVLDESPLLEDRNRFCHQNITATGGKRRFQRSREECSVASSALSICSQTSLRTQATSVADKPEADDFQSPAKRRRLQEIAVAALEELDFGWGASNFSLEVAESLRGGHGVADSDDEWAPLRGGAMNAGGHGHPEPEPSDAGDEEPLSAEDPEGSVPDAAQNTTRRFTRRLAVSRPSGGHSNVPLAMQSRLSPTNHLFPILNPTEQQQFPAVIAQINTGGVSLRRSIEDIRQHLAGNEVPARLPASTSWGHLSNIPFRPREGEEVTDVTLSAHTATARWVDSTLMFFGEHSASVPTPASSAARLPIAGQFTSSLRRAGAGPSQSSGVSSTNRPLLAELAIPRPLRPTTELNVAADTMSELSLDGGVTIYATDTLEGFIGELEPGAVADDIERDPSLDDAVSLNAWDTVEEDIGELAPDDFNLGFEVPPLDPLSNSRIPPSVTPSEIGETFDGVDDIYLQEALRSERSRMRRQMEIWHERRVVAGQRAFLEAEPDVAESDLVSNAGTEGLARNIAQEDIGVLAAGEFDLGFEVPPLDPLSNPRIPPGATPSEIGETSAQRLGRMHQRELIAAREAQQAQERASYAQWSRRRRRTEERHERDRVAIAEQRVVDAAERVTRRRRRESYARREGLATPPSRDPSMDHRDRRLRAAEILLDQVVDDAAAGEAAREAAEGRDFFRIDSEPEGGASEDGERAGSAPAASGLAEVLSNGGENPLNPRSPTIQSDNGGLPPGGFFNANVARIGFNAQRLIRNPLRPAGAARRNGRDVLEIMIQQHQNNHGLMRALGDALIPAPAIQRDNGGQGNFNAQRSLRNPWRPVRAAGGHGSPVLQILPHQNTQALMSGALGGLPHHMRNAIVPPGSRVTGLPLTEGETASPQPLANDVWEGHQALQRRIDETPMFMRFFEHAFPSARIGGIAFDRQAYIDSLIYCTAASGHGAGERGGLPEGVWYACTFRRRLTVQKSPKSDIPTLRRVRDRYEDRAHTRYSQDMYSSDAQSDEDEEFMFCEWEVVFPACAMKDMLRSTGAYWGVKAVRARDWALVEMGLDLKSNLCCEALAEWWERVRGVEGAAGDRRCRKVDVRVLEP